MTEEKGTVNIVEHYQKVLDIVRKHKPLFKYVVPYQVAVPPGWIDLVDTLLTCLDDAVKLEEKAVFKIIQIKEKFGGLRFYYSLEDASEALKTQVANLVEIAEAQSFGICYVCGEPGNIRTSGWITVRCPLHTSKLVFDHTTAEKDDYFNFETEFLKIVET